MAYLVDTNVLLRRARLSDPHYPAARRAIDNLAQQGESLYISSQTSSSVGTYLHDPPAVTVSVYRLPRPIKRSRNLNHSSVFCKTRPMFIRFGGSWSFRLEYLVSRSTTRD